MRFVFYSFSSILNRLIPSHSTSGLPAASSCWLLCEFSPSYGVVAHADLPRHPSNHPTTMQGVQSKHSALFGQQDLPDLKLHTSALLSPLADHTVIKSRCGSINLSRKLRYFLLACFSCCAKLSKTRHSYPKQRSAKACDSSFSRKPPCTMAPYINTPLYGGAMSATCPSPLPTSGTLMP